MSDHKAGGCPDGGVCHHWCADGPCFRVGSCGPLSGVFPGDQWPAALRAAGGQEKPTATHKPFTDDGVTYCGWDGHEGCGEVWPCSTVRAAAVAALRAAGGQEEPVCPLAEAGIEHRPHHYLTPVPWDCPGLPSAPVDGQDEPSDGPQSWDQVLDRLRAQAILDAGR